MALVAMSSENATATSNTVTLLVNPELQPLQLYPRSELPQYLFRTFAHRRSQGVNEPPQFLSAAKHFAKLQDQGTQRPQLDNTDLLNLIVSARCHLTYAQPRNFKSPFISFTSSLLVALARALRLDREHARAIRIAIIDTRKIYSQNAVFPATLLQGLINRHTSGAPKNTFDYSEEYIAFDILEAENVSYALFELLKARGLFAFLPKLHRIDMGGKWPKPQKDLRAALAKQQWMSQEEYAVLRRLVSCFEGAVNRLPLTVYFVSLRDRVIDGDAWLEETLTGGFGDEDFQNFLDAGQPFHLGKYVSPVFLYTFQDKEETSPKPRELRMYSTLTAQLCQILVKRQGDAVHEATGQCLFVFAWSSCMSYIAQTNADSPTESFAARAPEMDRISPSSSEHNKAQPNSQRADLARILQDLTVKLGTWEESGDNTLPSNEALLGLKECDRILMEWLSKSGDIELLPTRQDRVVTATTVTKNVFSVTETSATKREKIVVCLPGMKRNLEQNEVDDHEAQKAKKPRVEEHKIQEHVKITEESSVLIDAEVKGCESLDRPNTGGKWPNYQRCPGRAV